MQLSENLFQSDPEIRDPRFDLPVLAVGGLASALLSVAGATGLLYLSRSSTGPSVGPTAATLDDAFSTVFGFFAYAAVLIPVVVLTGPSDVSTGESFSFALALGVPLGLAVVIGSMIGAALGASHRMTFGRRRPRPAPPPKS